MSNTFLNKVVAERAALSLVNRRFSGKRQLAGLSSSAIEQWRSKVSLTSSHSVIQILIQLGEVAQTLSNRSNESFGPLSTEVQIKLDHLMKQLAASVAVLQSDG